MTNYVYFTATTDRNELKKQYKKLALELHPDRGGNESEFKEMANEYSGHLSDLLHGEFGNAAKIAYEEMIDEQMRDALNKIISLQGLIIEIVGSWIWLTGNTFFNKAEIKGAGFKFAGKKKAWYFSPADYRKKTAKKYDLDEIKDIYGTVKVQNEAIKAIG